MYFADLTEYQFGQSLPHADVLNVGWLSKDHVFSTGSAPSEFVSKLGLLVRSPINLYRGAHICEFCPAPSRVLSKGGISMLAPAVGTTGNGEIRVQGVGAKKRITYVAPALLHHYVAEHQYLPPQEFIDAVNAVNIADRKLIHLFAARLTCIRGGRLVFRDVSLRVEAGQVLALEGANGAGKTSLLRMIAGFLAPESGAITLKTSDVQIDDSEERGKHVGWLGHSDAVKPQMTPRETLQFFADVYRNPTLPLREGRRAKRSGEGLLHDAQHYDPSPKNSSLRSGFSTLPQGEGRVDELLDEVGLARARDLPAQYLSAGQKKRLALARLKLCGRPLWLLDEPLAALDVSGKALAARFMREHCASGGIVVAATHEALGIETAALSLS